VSSTAVKALSSLLSKPRLAKLLLKENMLKEADTAVLASVLTDVGREENVVDFEDQDEDGEEEGDDDAENDEGEEEDLVEKMGKVNL
jgi:hypothetical protein